MTYIPSLVVGTIAIFFSGIIFVLQRFIQNKYGLKEKQKTVNLKQKELNKKIKEDPKNPEIKALQKEVMALSMQMMKPNMVMMVIVSVLGLLVIGLINSIYLHSEFPIGSFWVLPQVLTWYALISLIMGIVFKLIFYLLEKQKIIN